MVPRHRDHEHILLEGRTHAVVELDIRDLKEGAGLEHVPSGNFSADSAWLQCAVLAHNLIRWTATIGQPAPVEQRIVARTVRQRLITKRIEVGLSRGSG